MARFNTAYGLCSVIDSRGLLGVSEDEDGCAVITLGKNMVIRCRISDQRQLNSWSTRISKLTSKVVYDSINKNYVGVFDDIHIKQWTTADSSIEKLKKCTMKNEIHEILLHRKSSFSKPSLFVLFKNGSCIELESVLQSKDEFSGFLQSGEVIQNAQIINQGGKFLIIVVKLKKKYHLCYSVQLEEDKYSIIPDTVKKVKLTRQGASMLGYCVLQEDKGNRLLAYWSDGFLYSLPLPLTGEEKSSCCNFLGTIHTVSGKFKVAMSPVSFTQIAFYASDLSEEGAFLGVYNVKFGLFQAQTGFKLFNKPPRIWLVENNIVVLMGQRLVCVPFTLQAEVLSALACSRAQHNKQPSLSQEISAVIPTVTWEKTKQKNSNDEVQGPDKIKELLSVCSSEGLSEYGVCKFVLNKLLEGKDYKALNWCLETFVDIPEDNIVKLLVFVLNDDDSDCTTVEDEAALDNNMKSEFLNKILRQPVNDVNLLASLRLNFKFEDCLALLSHLCSVTEEYGCESNMLIWTILLLDAFYQQFILSRDVKVLEIMNKLRERIESEIKAMNSLKQLLPLLISMKRGKEIAKAQFHSRSYSIEKFRLYQ